MSQVLVRVLNITSFYRLNRFIQDFVWRHSCELNFSLFGGWGRFRRIFWRGHWIYFQNRFRLLFRCRFRFNFQNRFRLYFRCYFRFDFRDRFRCDFRFDFRGHSRFWFCVRSHFFLGFRFCQGISVGHGLRIWNDDRELDFLRGKKVAAISGIAAPRGFEESLERMGGELVYRKRFGDHHRYTQQEILDMINDSRDRGAEVILTTEKDAVRFPKIDRRDIPVYFLRIAIDLLSGAEDFQQLIERICFK